MSGLLGTLEYRGKIRLPWWEFLHSSLNAAGIHKERLCSLLNLDGNLDVPIQENSQGGQKKSKSCLTFPRYVEWYQGIQ